MIARKADDEEVQRVVSNYSYISAEATLRQVTKDWSSADFLHALDRLGVKPPLGDIPHMRDLCRTMRAEREAEEARVRADEITAQRHSELTQHLDDLKRPHWSVIPNFWITVVSAVAAVVAAVGVWLALLK